MLKDDIDDILGCLSENKSQSAFVKDIYRGIEVIRMYEDSKYFSHLMNDFKSRVKKRITSRIVFLLYIIPIFIVFI